MCECWRFDKGDMSALAEMSGAKLGLFAPPVKIIESKLTVCAPGLETLNNAALSLLAHLCDYSGRGAYDFRTAQVGDEG